MSSCPFISTAPEYFKRNIPVIPLYGKKPIPKGWQHFQHKMPSIEDIQNWQSKYQNNNIGIVAGSQSGFSFIDVDIEDEAICNKLLMIFPKSPWCRIGKKGYVLAYKSTDLPSFKIYDQNGKSLVEFFSTSGQIVLPPSIHPETKKAYTANCNLYDLVDQVCEVPRNIEELIRSELLVHGFELTGFKKRKSIIGTGGRDVWLTKQAAKLVDQIKRGEISLKEAVDKIEYSICHLMEQPSSDKIPAGSGEEKVIRFLMNDLANDLNFELPFDWDKGLSEEYLFQWGLEEITYTIFSISELISQFVYVKDPHLLVDTQTLERFTGDQFDYFYRSQMGVGKPHILLLKDEELRRFQGFTYEPRGDKVITTKYNKIQRLNLWVPTEFDHCEQIRKVSESDIAPLIEFIDYLLPNKKEANHLLDWIGHLIQKPATRINHGIILGGGQGIGKNWLSDLIRNLVGWENSVSISTSDLTSQFNDWIEAKSLVVVEEIMAYGKPSISNKLKNYVTNHVVRINAKNARHYDIQNYAHFFMTTNHEDALMLDKDDRRFFVLWSPAIEKDKSFYSNLFNWRDENLFLIYSYFMQRCISEFNPKSRAPMTEAKRRMIGFSQSELEAWLSHKIEYYEKPCDKDIGFFNDIQIAAWDDGIGKISPQKFAQALRKLGGCQLKQMRLGGTSRTAIGIGDQRVKPYVFRHRSSWEDRTKEQMIKHLKKISNTQKSTE